MVTSKPGVVTVFSKCPEPGKVKTRLAADIGNELAVKVYEKLLHDLQETVSESGKTILLSYDGAFNKDAPFFEADFYSRQEGDDIGEKMLRAMFDALNLNSGPAILIGADLPDINKTILEKAFEVLREKDLVLGPSKDGGFYLFGLNRYHENLFTDIRWNSGDVFKQVLNNAQSLSLRYGQVQEISDIDNLSDLRSSRLNTWFQNLK